MKFIESKLGIVVFINPLTGFFVKLKRKDNMFLLNFRVFSTLVGTFITSTSELLNNLTGKDFLKNYLTSGFFLHFVCHIWLESFLQTPLSSSLNNLVGKDKKNLFNFRFFPTLFI